MTYFGYQNPPMAYFPEVCHGSCALRYIKGVLVLRKLGFRGFKDQFDAKKANFRGLMAKICHYWVIWATRTHLWPIFMEYAMVIDP